MMWYLAEETVLFVLRYRIVTIVYFLGVSDSWILCSLDPRLKPGLALAIWSTQAWTTTVAGTTRTSPSSMARATIATTRRSPRSNAIKAPVSRTAPLNDLAPGRLPSARPFCVRARRSVATDWLPEPRLASAPWLKHLV